jgi:hypothetical protein
MKKKSTSQSAFFNLRILMACVFCVLGVAVALFAQGNRPKQAQQSARTHGNQDAPGTQRPDIGHMIGPVVLNADLRNLPYLPPKEEFDERVLTRFPHGDVKTRPPEEFGVSKLSYLHQLLKNLWRPVPTMPTPLLTFEGESAAQACACAPPDSDGDVGPNHYVEAINVAFRVFDKSGNPLSPVTTYNSLFAPLTGTPCSNQNDGDPFVFYDHMADRWVISDFAFPGLPGSGPFYQCIAVSQTNDPVSGGWFLYAVQHEPSHPTWVGDYPKMALWSDPQPGGAYHLTVNLFDGPTLAFQGVRVFAFDRAAMLAGDPSPTLVAFTLGPAGVTDGYSLVAATFRAGNPPPAGRDEMVLGIGADFPTYTQVRGWIFHVDFDTPANSTFGVGANHTPNSLITVDPFINAQTPSNGFSVVPQQGTADLLDTLGDKIMTPVVYRFDGGTESLWADSTVCQEATCTQPTGIRWYQFDVTGGTFPATPVQQQTWTNNNDGLFRFMPSIAVDNSGNAAIGYATSSSTAFPGIRYAGRLANDPPGNLVQGEATLFSGTGSQLDTNSRWGDYSYTAIDPSDGMSFWSVGEYYANTGSFNWHTRIGKFNFVSGGPSPTPTPSGTPSASPTPTPGQCSWGAGADLPSVGTRFAGVFFPANGKFYAMGGRSNDTGGGEFTNPFEYDPVLNTWTTKAATYPDGNVNNMACGVLNDSGTDYIYCVGGSQSVTNTVTGRVFRYDPVADVISTVSGGDWPPGVDTLPGGFTVFSNQFFILGGFEFPGQPTGTSTDQIWQFTPGTNAWVQKNAVLPAALAYVPAAAIGNLIYTGGGADITAGVLTDETNSFVYDPVADSIDTIADIPRATSNTRGLNLCGQMYVLGGAFNSISNEVDIYDPVSNSWSVGQPFATARRNSAADTDGTNNIFMAGGYDGNVAIIASTEIFNCPVSPCGVPSPTPTPTPSVPPPTPTPSIPPSPTPTPSPTPPRETPTPRPRPTPHPRP